MSASRIFNSAHSTRRNSLPHALYADKNRAKKRKNDF